MSDDSGMCLRLSGNTLAAYDSVGNPPTSSEHFLASSGSPLLAALLATCESGVHSTLLTFHITQVSVTGF